MTTVKIAKSRFSFLRKRLGIEPTLEDQRAKTTWFTETPADPEIIWVRLVTDREHRMSAVPDPE